MVPPGTETRNDMLKQIAALMAPACVMVLACCLPNSFAAAEA